MLTGICKSFLIDDEHKYDVFEFDDLCSAYECLFGSTAESDSPPHLLT